MKPNWYAIITRAVDEGVALGWNRAHKHTDIPEVEYIQERMNDAIMELLGEVIDWELNSEH